MKILTVYNIAGISGRENSDFYIESINSIFNQKNIEQKVVISSCLNNDDVILKLKNNFPNLEIVRFKHKFTVNMTFNKTVKIMIEKYGNFDAYMYVDSGVVLTDENSLYSAANTLKYNQSVMATLQTDTDTGFHYFGSHFKLDSPTAQVVDEDFIVPFGIGINLHAQLFSDEIYQIYGNIIPDVFVAFCTESTFPFVCASICKKWYIVKDILLIHRRSIDGAASGHSHQSNKFLNPWNNLFGNRDANDFINDPKAIEAGLGYEECNDIMKHKKSSYIDDYIPKNKDLLIEKIKQYFYLSKEELDYDKIPYEIF